MKVAYLTWLEDLESPILKGQVIDILKSISAKLQSTDKIYLISFQLFFFRPYSQVIKRMKRFRSKEVELDRQGIKLIIIPVLGLPRMLPSKLFSAQWYFLPLLFIQVFLTLIVFYFCQRPDIVHCRSYPTTVGTTFFRILLKRFRLVFDPRSDYPGENATAGQWRKSSLSYHVWKYLEKLFLDVSDTTICISKSFSDHYQNISQKAKFVQIPNNVDVRKFTRNNSFRIKFRDEYDIRDNEIVLCYSGSMGSSYWHSPKLYANYIIQFRKLDLKHRFLFITPFIESLDIIFQNHDINKNEYILIKSHFKDVPRYLSCADIGMILMERKDIRMSIKTAEYLSIGLPVLTNSNVLGAKEIVEDNNAGIVMELNSDLRPLSEFCEDLVLNKEKIIKKNKELACSLFSNDVVSNKYVDVYKKLLNQ